MFVFNVRDNLTQENFSTIITSMDAEDKPEKGDYSF